MTPPSLLGRMGVMAQNARSLGAPTATQRRQYDIVAADFQKVLGELRGLVDTDLKRVEAAAETDAAGGAPPRIETIRGIGYRLVE